MTFLLRRDLAGAINFKGNGSRIEGNHDNCNTDELSPLKAARVLTVHLHGRADRGVTTSEPGPRSFQR